MNQGLTQSEIDDLVARYPLPEGVDDCVMNREELAEALATSLNTISAWLREGMPALQNGGQGQAYELKLSQCWAWRQGKKHEEDLRSQAVKRSQAAMRLALVGGASGDTIEALDPKQRKEILEAQMIDERFRAQRNQLLRRDDVREMLEELFAMVRDAMEAAPDRVERIEAMPPKAITAFIDVCDGVIGDLKKRVEQFWLLRRETSQPDKRNLFDQ